MLTAARPALATGKKGFKYPAGHMSRNQPVSLELAREYNTLVYIRGKTPTYSKEVRQKQSERILETKPWEYNANFKGGEDEWNG